MVGKLRRYGIWALVLALAIVLANCRAAPPEPQASPTAPTASPAPSGVLVYGSGGQPVNLEPGNITDGNSIIVQDQIYNRLMEFKPGTTELQPALATEWSSSADGKTWTFRLRQGVIFHDGTVFDAEAVKFNVERWWDPKHPQGFRNAGKIYEIWQQIFGGFKGSPQSLLQAVNAVDPLTVQFVLKQPFSAFPSAIAAGFLALPVPRRSSRLARGMARPDRWQWEQVPMCFRSGVRAIGLCWKKIRTTGRRAFQKWNSL